MFTRTYLFLVHLAATTSAHSVTLRANFATLGHNVSRAVTDLIVLS